MKAKYIITIALFLIPIIGIGAFSVLDTDATVSVTENRNLKSFPAFSFSDLFFGDYTVELEDYYKDTFPLRETFLAANKELNRIYYFSPDSGSDAVQLLIPQTNDIAQGGEAIGPESPAPSDSAAELTPEPLSPSQGPVEPDPSPSDEPPATASPEPEEPEPELNNPEKADLHTGSILLMGDRAVEITSMVPEVMTGYAGFLNTCLAKMPDTRIISLVTPNAGEFYSPEEFHTGIHSQKDIIDQTYTQMDASVVKVDAYSEIRKHIDEYVYFRTDHHWTQLGAYYAYRAFCTSLDLEPAELEEFEQGTIEGFVGSMYTFTSGYPQSSVLKNNPDTVSYYRPKRDFTTRIYTDSTMNESTAFNGYLVSGKVTANNKYLAFISGDTPLMRIRTDVGNGRKILVLKESFGNAFVPFLANHYEEVYVVDPRKYYGNGTPDFDLPSFVSAHEIDEVLVIDYSLVVSSSNYVRVLNNVIK